MAEMEHVLSKIATLERRADHLQRQLDENACSAGARSFVQAELAALKTALVTMRLHGRAAEGLPAPMVVMRELVEAVEKRGKLDPELTRLLERASSVVADFAAP
jgi:hypothetical protein